MNNGRMNGSSACVGVYGARKWDILAEYGITGAEALREWYAEDYGDYDKDDALVYVYICASAAVKKAQKAEAALTAYRATTHGAQNARLTQELAEAEAACADILKASYAAQDAVQMYYEIITRRDHDRVHSLPYYQFIWRLAIKQVS